MLQRSLTPGHLLSPLLSGSFHTRLLSVQSPVRARPSLYASLGILFPLSVKRRARQASNAFAQFPNDRRKKAQWELASKSRRGQRAPLPMRFCFLREHRHCLRHADTAIMAARLVIRSFQATMNDKGKRWHASAHPNRLLMLRRYASARALFFLCRQRLVKLRHKRKTYKSFKSTSKWMNHFY